MDMLNGIILKELTVSELRNMVEQSFDKNEKGLKRVNKNLKLIRSSLSITNKKFIVYEILMYILIFSYHLVLIGEKSKISFLGLEITSTEFIIKWFLLIPSILFILQAINGYLRMKQQETIEWLLSKYYEKEYKSDIFRLGYPSNYIMALDILRRSNNKKTIVKANLIGFLMAFFNVVFPIIYISGVYIYLFFDLYKYDVQVIVSFCVSSFMLYNAWRIILESNDLLKNDDEN